MSDNYQQQQQSNFSFNSTSSKSSKHNHHHSRNHQNYPHYYYPHHQKSYSQVGEWINHRRCLYMDEGFSSPLNPNPNDLSLNLDFTTNGIWATNLLLDCSRAVTAHDTPNIQQLMWTLNELSSPYGDTEQKILHYFLQALFARVTSSGPRTLLTLSSAASSFDSPLRTALRFQELSPWSTFGHVAANGAILESFLEVSSSSSLSSSLHILDLSNTFCTQWPTFLEALATRSGNETPHLTITTVVSSTVQCVMKEIGTRIEKFARLMGVLFKFNVIHHDGDLSTLNLYNQLTLQDSMLAVNLVNALHSVSPASGCRDAVLSAIRQLQPQIVTVVEEEADLDSSKLDETEGFLKGFRESLRFFSAYLNSLEESFPRMSDERLWLERAAGRAVVDLVACPAEESAERRGTATGWSKRLTALGMSPTKFSDDVADDVRALLKRYREGWSMREEAAGILLAWKEQPLVWTSVWKLR